MQVTDEMVEKAAAVYERSEGSMRAALEAALGQFMLQYGDNVELQEAEQVGFRRAAACIEDLAGALKEISSLADVDADNRSTIAHSVLERWGLK